MLDLDYPRFVVHVLDDSAKDEVKVIAADYGFRCEISSSFTMPS